MRILRGRESWAAGDSHGAEVAKIQCILLGQFVQMKDLAFIGLINVFFLCEYQYISSANPSHHCQELPTVTPVSYLFPCNINGSYLLSLSCHATVFLATKRAEYLYLEIWFFR